MVLYGFLIHEPLPRVSLGNLCTKMQLGTCQFASSKWYVPLRRVENVLIMLKDNDERWKNPKVWFLINEASQENNLILFPRIIQPTNPHSATHRAEQKQAWIPHGTRELGRICCYHTEPGEKASVRKLISSADVRFGKADSFSVTWGCE